MRKSLFLFVLISLGKSFLIGQVGGGGARLPSSSISPLAIIIGIIFTVMGLMVILMASVSLAIREIALNTRSEKSQSKQNYDEITTISPIMKVVGWILIVAGWVIPIAFKL